MKRKGIQTISGVAATVCLFPAVAMKQFFPDDVVNSDLT